MKMKVTQRILGSTVIGACLVIIGSLSPFSYATDPGNMEAINSASSDRRNIIGIEISTATQPQRVAAGCAEEGIFISAVIPGHPAATAGLKAGDIMTKINGTSVTTHSEALEIMNALEAGQRYPVEVCRIENGQAQKLTLNVLVEKVQEKAIGKIS